MKGYPYELIVDPTNVCQLRCPLCCTGMGKPGRTKGFMEFALFKQIIDELGHYAFHIFLHNWGEPLLHKEICKFIYYAHNANLGTTISSNLSFPLDERKVGDIIDSKLDTLVISLDGITSEVYSKYKSGGNFSQVISNIKLFAREKKKKKSKTPYLEWQFLVMKHNEHQMDEADKFAKQLKVNSIVFAKILPPFGINTELMAKKWLPTNKYFRSHEWFNKSDNLIKKCWRLWRSVVINWDGTISPCDYAYDRLADFALFDRPFNKIWNNSCYLSARNLFTKNKIKSIVDTVCHTCNVPKR